MARADVGAVIRLPYAAFLLPYRMLYIRVLIGMNAGLDMEVHWNGYRR